MFSHGSQRPEAYAWKSRRYFSLLFFLFCSPTLFVWLNASVLCCVCFSVCQHLPIHDHNGVGATPAPGEKCFIITGQVNLEPHAADVVIPGAALSLLICAGTSAVVSLNFRGYRFPWSFCIINSLLQSTPRYKQEKLQETARKHGI